MKRKRQKPKSKAMAIIIAGLVALSMCTFHAPQLSVNAHSPVWSIPTQAYINVTPNPVIIGQNITITIWLNQPPPTANGTYGDRWQNMTIRYVRPDGTTRTLGPYSSDETGRVVVNKTTDIVGPHSFWMTFGGQTLEGLNLAPGTTNEFIGDYYQPSTSDVFGFSVQTTLLNPTPTPLATPSSTPNPTIASTPTPSPTIIPLAKTVQATTDKGATVDLPISGNISSSQMSNTLISTSQSDASTTLSFTLSGEKGVIGFSNITVPKNIIPYGTIPTIYIDGQPTQEKDLTQDATNYYIWYSIHFSTHEISVVFSSEPAQSPSPKTLPAQESFLTIPVIVVSIIVVLVVAGLLVYFIEQKHKKS